VNGSTTTAGTRRPPRRAAGLLAQRARLRLGTTVGAFAVGIRGDWESLPRRADLALPEHHDVVRWTGAPP
jgi:hypothetical protein